jgi:hypothetical protein
MPTKPLATTDGQHGAVVIHNGQVVYTPADGYVGTDTFTYTVTSGGVEESDRHGDDDQQRAGFNGRACHDARRYAGKRAKPAGNDTDADGDTLTLPGLASTGSIIWQATPPRLRVGTLTINATAVTCLPRSPTGTAHCRR